MSKEKDTAMMLMLFNDKWRFNYILLTLARVGGVKGYYIVYCNRFVYRQNSSEPTNIGTLKILPTDVKSYKDEK